MPQHRSAGTLYVVALPLGNVADLSNRAREILQQIGFIACEDTRKLRELFRRAGLDSNARLLVHNAFNEKNSAAGLIALLKEGNDVALVSDAGTPHVSDPGVHLLRQCYVDNIAVVPVPGPSALTALLSIAPFATEPLLFLGFLSPKPGRRQNTLQHYSHFTGSIALYESVHRLRQCLADIASVFPNAEILIGREMTKTHEEFFWGKVEDAIKWADGKKGEFTLLIRPTS